MADVVSLIADLRVTADIASTELTDTQLQEWVVASLAQHNPSYTLGSLPSAEAPLVKYLTWILVCYWRANKAAKYYSVSGRDGSSNKAEVMRNNLDMAEKLREQYEKLAKQMGVDPAPAIIVSDITKFDPTESAMTPDNAHNPPNTPTLTLTHYDDVGGTVRLSWTKASPASTFIRYRIFYSTTTDEIYDVSTLDEDYGTYSGISPDATLLRTVDDIQRLGTLVENLDPGEDYHFAVMVEDTNGRTAVSPTVSVGPNYPLQNESALTFGEFLLEGVLSASTTFQTGLGYEGTKRLRKATLSVDVAPVTNPLIVIVSIGGASARDLTITLPVGETSVTEDFNETLQDSETFSIKTGATVGSTENATLTLGVQ